MVLLYGKYHDRENTVATKCRIVDVKTEERLSSYPNYLPESAESIIAMPFTC